MAETDSVLFDDRGVLAVAGEDARAFLQGLVSNDMDRVADDRAVHAALLTPQGKYLHDFFAVGLEDAVLLEGEAARLGDLGRRLGLYKLRSKVTVGTRADLAVAAILDAAALGLDDAEPGTARPFAGGVAFVDPRHAGLGARAVIPANGAAEALAAAGLVVAPRDAYDARRIRLGVPDGSRDMEIEKSILLECGFDELHGVDWDKGCYMGQELTARTKYRGLVKKRLVPVRVDGTLPEPGTPITAAGAEVGTIRSGSDGWALALMRLDALETGGGPFSAGAATVVPEKPDWATF